MGKVLLGYKLEPARNRHEARCTKCLALVAWVNDEALYLYPEHAKLGPVVHNCPCTCSSEPYTCPVGRKLVSAIQQRKGNQEHVRTA